MSNEQLTGYGDAVAAAQIHFVTGGAAPQAGGSDRWRVPGTTAVLPHDLAVATHAEVTGSGPCITSLAQAALVRAGLMREAPTDG